MLNIAVVTPYFQEPDEMLRHCHRSVMAQTYPCTHLLVADGHARQIFETGPRLLHVTLPKSNDDFGNMPRFIGGALADSYGFDAITYLDADNWLEPVHLERMAAAHERGKAPLVTCKRIFRHLDGSVLPYSEPAEDRFVHVDTNCWLITRAAYSLLKVWRVPRRVSALGDRIFLEKARHDRFAIAETQHRTVNYRTKHVPHYIGAGVPVPDGVYTQNNLKDAFQYLRSVEGVMETVAATGFYPPIN